MRRSAQTLDLPRLGILAVIAFVAVAGNAGFTQGAAQDAPARAAPPSPKGGEALFRLNCADCHGLDARGGGHGPSLISSRVLRTGSEAALTKIITQGIPGTAMPANDLTGQETRLVIAYVRSLAGGEPAPLRGDAAKGKALFFGKGNCVSCHMVNGQGGRLGPDLSLAGSSRSAEFLTDSIREPSKDLTEGMGQLNSQFESPAIYETVTVVMPDGRRIVGVPKDEDNFSIQFMDVNQELHSFMKKDLKEVLHERKSLMPAYSEEAISETELADLLAYLRSLHPATAPLPALTKPAATRPAEK